MATVTVRTAAGRPPTHKRAVLKAGVVRLVLPITNAETQLDFGRKWTAINRPGLDDLLRPGSRKPYVVTLDATLIYRNGKTVARALRELQILSETGLPVACSYGSTETGTFRITGLRPKVTHRFADNNASEGAVQIELTRIGDERLTIAARTKPTKPPKKKSSSSKKKVVRYTVRRGDSLIKIASKVCHNTGHWQRIAADNKIRDPRKLKVGQRLTITCL